MSTTLPVERARAVKAFKNADGQGQALLVDLFGKEVFSQKITDRIKSFEDACVELGIRPPLSEFSNCTSDEIAYKKLKVIVQALNEGWTPDWDNSSQRKWFPYFWMNGPGFRFAGSDYVCVSSLSCVGSRLCVHSEELANYLGQAFITLYSDLLTVQNGENQKSCR